MRLKGETTLADELVGWYGAVSIVAAYASVSFGVLSPAGVLYQALNITGSLGIIYISYLKSVYQSVALNVVWAVIGATALVRLFI